MNPNIQIQRARFSEITSQSIEHAIRALNQPDLNTSNAVDVRQELDLRIGIEFIRLILLQLCNHGNTFFLQREEEYSLLEVV